ncbi:MAG: hypothetical protein OSJ74_00775 [Clostridia bacterium]|nr:hypothetical protein [Clostridia bacterium]
MDKNYLLKVAKYAKIQNMGMLVQRIGGCLSVNKKVIIFLCILIALPFGGDYMLAKGIIDNNIALIIGGAVCCVIWLAFIVITNYVMRQAKKNKQPMTPEEQQQRNITFAKNLSKTLCDDEKDKKERCEKEQKSMNNFNEFKLVLIEKYSQSVFSYIEKITEIYSILFLKMFDNTEIPMSSILVKPYSSTCSQLLKDKILFDGLQCTESKNQSINKQVQELTEVFIQGLKKRIQENSEYDTELLDTITTNG